MKKILIPTDLSDLGDYAYNLANKIAQPTNAEIHILSIVPAPPEVLFDNEGNVKDCGDINLTSLRKSEMLANEKMTGWLEGKDNIFFSKVKIGNVEEDILNYINKQEIDLVVMGTKGAFGAKEALMGSHAGHISQQAPIPVLTLKCDRSGMEIKDLLLVCDFHKEDKVDLKVLKDLQTAFNANINLLKVNTANDFEPERSVVSKMQEFAKINMLNNVNYYVYCDETVEKGIVNFSDDKGIDIVTLGTHQRGSISRFFKKSISNEIVNHIFQPILTFPE